MTKYILKIGDNPPKRVRSYSTGQSAQLEEFGKYSADEALRGCFLTCSQEIRDKIEEFIESEDIELVLDGVIVRRA